MNDKILIVASNYYKNIIDNLILGSTNFLKENNYNFEIIKLETNLHTYKDNNLIIIRKE